MPMQKSVLDALEEMVYVSDTETYELLYVNEAMARNFHINRNQLKGLRCHEVIFNSPEPCAFCTTPRLCPGKYYTWSVYNPCLKGTFKLKDTLVTYNGRPARIEVASNITEYVKNTALRQDEHAVNKLYKRCISLLNCRPVKFKPLLNSILLALLKRLNASRGGVFIFAEGEENLSFFTQVSTRGSVESSEHIINSVLGRSSRMWLQTLVKRSDLYVEDALSVTEYGEDTPEMHAFFKELNIRSFYLHSLWYENELLGVVVIDDPLQEDILRMRERLHNFAALLAAALWRYSRSSSIERALYLDYKTGLFNRACFMRDRLGEKSVNVGLILIDVNGLKDINEKEGHDKGDELLKTTAEAISDLYGAENCYRFGDDEFAVALINVSDNTFDEAMFTVKSLFAGGLGFTASVGGCKGECAELEHIITVATNQMLNDKQDFYTHNPQGARYRLSTDQLLRRLSQPHTIRTLLKRGDFFPYIQPIYDREGKLVKGESLVRLNYHGNLIPPGRFIPILESMNMTREIDFHMFKKTCELLRTRRERGQKCVPIATNFSRFTVTAPDFVERIEEIVAQTGVNVRDVFLEVTESAEEREHQTLVEVTHKLTALGYHVAVDDFGVANANLLTFANMAMDTIKFDKQITDALREGNMAYETVRMLLQLMHSRGIKAVAEGVETLEQVQMLNKLGVDFLQGFYFSKPLPVEDFIRLCDEEPSENGAENGADSGKSAG